MNKDSEIPLGLEIPLGPDGETDIAALAAMLTDDEINAMMLEIEYLEPHASDDAAWERAALAGQCFCCGRFTCTRCQIRQTKAGTS